MIGTLAHQFRQSCRALYPVVAITTVTTRLFSATAAARQATATATASTTSDHDDQECPPRVTPALAPPKPPMSAFMRYALHALANRPDDAPPLQYWMKTMSEQWHALPASERDQYVEAYARDKQIYQDALQADKERYSPLQHKLYKLAKAKADYAPEASRRPGTVPRMEYLPDAIPTPRQLFMQEYRQQEQDKWWTDPSIRGDKPPTCVVLDKQARKLWNAMTDADQQRYVEKVHDLVEQAFRAI
ncbi:hypothetical protein GGF31_006067 [Allomyces arbusculus]|nr:hypothetical protein GGF31_006067 [Allomyces arbusculus]